MVKDTATVVLGAGESLPLLVSGDWW